MAQDPTQALRDKVLSVIPGAAGESIAKAKAERESQLAADEANNYVMQRDPVILPPEAQNVVNPDIPITPPPGGAPISQEVATTQAAPAPASAISAGPAPASVAPVSDGADKLYGELDAHNKAAEDRHFKAEEERNKRIDTITNKMNELEKNPFSFDNRSIFEKQSTGGKIALLIGGALASLSPQSAQNFATGVQNSIKADLDIQKAKFDEQKENKNTLFAQLNRELGNKEAAGLAWESLAYKGIADKLAFQRDRAQSAQQKTQADRMYGLALQESQYKREAALLKSSGQTANQTIPGYTGTNTNTTKVADLQERKASKESAESAIAELQRLAKEGSAVPGSTNKDVAAKLRTKLSADLAKAMFGRSSDSELAVAESLIPDTTSLLRSNSKNNAAFNALKIRLKTDFNKAAEAAGFKDKLSYVKEK